MPRVPACAYCCSLVFRPSKPGSTHKRRKKKATSLHRMQTCRLSSQPESVNLPLPAEDKLPLFLKILTEKKKIFAAKNK